MLLGIREEQVEKTVCHAAERDGKRGEIPESSSVGILHPSLDNVAGGCGSSGEHTRHKARSHRANEARLGLIFEFALYVRVGREVDTTERDVASPARTDALVKPSYTDFLDGSHHAPSS